MTTKHTPGPWKVGAIESGQEYCDGIPNVVRGWISIPDAHLIAAAPDLLEALELVFEELMDDGYALPHDVVEAVEAAIAKARRCA